MVLYTTPSEQAHKPGLHLKRYCEHHSQLYSFASSLEFGFDREGSLTSRTNLLRAPACYVRVRNTGSAVSKIEIRKTNSLKPIGFNDVPFFGVASLGRFAAVDLVRLTPAAIYLTMFGHEQPPFA